MRLYAGRWSTDGATFHEQINDPEGVGVRWTLKTHGMMRLEFMVRCRNKWDRYERYSSHLGQRAGIYAAGYPIPILGFVSEVDMAGANRVKYIIKGPFFRLEDDVNTSVYATSDTVDAVIKDTLTNHVSIADSDQSNVASNSTTAGGWQPRYPQGSTPLEVFEDMLRKSDGSSDIYDLWFRDLPFAGVLPGGWVAYYQARSSTAAANWQANVSDLNRATPSRDIHKLITDVEIFYGTITGAADNLVSGGSPPTDYDEDDYLLWDASATFQSSGVKPGDRVVNVTDASRATVQRLEYNDPEEVLYTTPLEGGSDNSWDNGDTYAIERRDAYDSATDSATAKYWTVKRKQSWPEMTATQAGQYATALLKNDAAQNNPFSITSPWIQDGNGAKWPLFAVIAQGGGYIRLNDIFPAASMYTNSTNNESTFIITGLDYYGGRRPSLSVEVDNPSRRLDARLRAAGIIGSEIISR